jgi:hypothetical protein
VSTPVALRSDYDATRLRSLARWAKDGPQTRRLLALAAIYDGGTRTEAAQIGGVGLQTVRDWGLALQRPRPGWASGRQSPGSALDPEPGASSAPDSDD